VGVETAGFAGLTTEEAARVIREAGLQVCSAHTALPVGGRQNEVLDTARALGCTRIVSGLGERDYSDLDSLKRSCDRLNEALDVARRNGLTFGMHNHWWEYRHLPDGRRVDQVMLEHLDGGLLFEVDVYWVKTAGVDPVEVVQSLGRRAPLLHIKDGPAEIGQPMTAVGAGTLDVPAIIEAGQPHTEWLIVELDAHAGDMFTAVAQSYEYLVKRGLARGKQR
jgi:sugar phosphate isomerase/epimerase